MGLQDEIDTVRSEIRTDDYTVSIGEWMSLYENHEVDVHPEFQRFFRWDKRQKTRFIESILLGIPVPPIFVAQRNDGIWDVVDGQQRLSTLFEFAGILRDEDGNIKPALEIEGTEYLPSLAGKKWEDEDEDVSLTSPQRLFIKRGKLGVSIILKESDESNKFELFQRLNTGGSHLSDQEVRNCILIWINRDFYFWMHNLSIDPNFKECIALTDRASNEQYDVELVLRFLAFRTFEGFATAKLGDLNDFLTKKMREMAMSNEFDRNLEEDAFKQTFSLLANASGSNSFRKFENEK